MFKIMTNKKRKIANLEAKIKNRDKLIQNQEMKIKELEFKNKEVLKESSQGYIETKEILCEKYRKDEILEHIYELVSNCEFGKTNPYVLIREIKNELEGSNV